MFIEPICFHNHTLLSDGKYGPAEMVRRCLAKGLKTVALTDHVDSSTIDDVIRKTVKAAVELSRHWPIRVIPGCEITHAPKDSLAELVVLARALGAKIVLVHGETAAEPVEPGTNRAAIAAGVEILAHPGLIGEQDVRFAIERGVALELSLRERQFDGNIHLLTLLKATGLLERVRLVLNADAHHREQIKCEKTVQAFDEACVQPHLNQTEQLNLYRAIADTMSGLAESCS